MNLRARVEGYILYPRFIKDLATYQDVLLFQFSNGTPTERASEFLKHHLQPLMTAGMSYTYIRDMLAWPEMTDMHHQYSNSLRICIPR